METGKVKSLTHLDELLLKNPECRFHIPVEYVNIRSYSLFSVLKLINENALSYEFKTKEFVAFETLEEFIEAIESDKKIFFKNRENGKIFEALGISHVGIKISMQALSDNLGAIEYGTMEYV